MQSISSGSAQVFRYLCNLFLAMLLIAPCHGKGSQPSTSAKSSGAKIECTTLDQRSHFGGDQTIWLAPNAVKVYNKKNHACILAKAPDWKVFVYNEKRKVIYSCPLSKWQGGNIQGLAQYFGRLWDSYEWIASGTQAYAGVRTHKYVQGKIKKGVPIPEKFATDGEYLSWEDCKVDSNAILFLRKLTTVPSLGAVPLMLKAAHSKTDPAKIDLETIKLSKQKVDTLIFDAPTGYKPVKLENDVYSDENLQGLMEDITN